MSEPSGYSIVPSRLYSLREIEALFQVRCEEIVRYASESQISICVLVPPKKRVYHFELDNLDWDRTDYDVERVFRSLCHKSADAAVQVDPWLWPNIAGASTLALVVDSHTCNQVYLFGYQRRRFFTGALQFYEGPTIGKGQVLFIRPAQEFLDLPDDVEPEEEFPNCRLGVYGDSVRFDEYSEKGLVSPEELEISIATLYILGEQVEIFLSRTGPVGRNSFGAFPEGAIVKLYPPPKSSMTVPTFASSRIKALSDIAKLRWGGVKPGLSQAEYDSINASLIEDLRRARNDVPLAEDEIDIAAGIVRPLWAQRGLLPAIKESRLQTWVTPEFEKILLVAERVHDWKKSVASAPGSKPRYSRAHPSDKVVIAWLADPEHFSVSATHKAPVAAKLLRSVSGARKAKGSAKPKAPRKRSK